MSTSLKQVLLAIGDSVMKSNPEIDVNKDVKKDRKKSTPEIVSVVRNADSVMKTAPKIVSVVRICFSLNLSFLMKSNPEIDENIEIVSVVYYFPFLRSKVIFISCS